MAGYKRGESKTRLSRIHPYPAMIADTLALGIARKYVKRHSRVLDPFCGTARTLYAASAVGGNCFGIDVNPLAVLIAQAKNVRKLPKMPDPKQLTAEYSFAKFNIQPGRKVKWFSKSTEREICALICWINSLSTERPTLLALACILSATVREVCFCRKRQWKLHRLSARQRRVFKPSALMVFRRRLQATAKSLPEWESRATVTIQRGDSKILHDVLKDVGLPISYDLIFTSPPYGDSRSTVGYGGISSICLGVLQHLNRLRLPFLTGQQIDAKCLGGETHQDVARNVLTTYWKGGANTSEWCRIRCFLNDLALTCKQMSLVSHAGTKIILVISRRCVRRQRLYLDRFLQDELTQYGFWLSESFCRRIERKITPFVIDRKARTNRSDKVRTMDYEFLLVFEKKSSGVV
jgi:SAM-dependent methyltransferase